MPKVIVSGIPAWVDARRLLGDHGWASGPEGLHAELDRRAAADLQARLRGVGLGGQALTVVVRPPLKRPLVRQARTDDARRRRVTTPGFLRPGVRLDAEARWSLTPEALALELGRRAGGRAVVDATCGAGGNALGFARAGSPVTAIDVDPGKLALARHNAAVYGVASRIRFLAGRAEDLLPTVDAELVFVDPPWGEAWDRSRTGLTDLPGLAAILSASGGREVWVKVPPSFDPAELTGFAPEAWFGGAEGDRQRVKFVLMASGPSRPPS